MKIELQLELTDVFGGDGELRYEEIEKVQLIRTRTKTFVRESIGLSVELTTQEDIKSKRLESVNTFRLDEEGRPLLRLGGAHGKFWGSLKAAAKQLYDLVDVDFKKSYKAVLDMVNVQPMWVPLDIEGDTIRIENIPQVLRGGGGMIVQHFDAIPKATCKVYLIFPDKLKGKVEKLLNQVEVGSHFNKRRTMIKVKKKRTCK